MAVEFSGKTTREELEAAVGDNSATEGVEHNTTITPTPVDGRRVNGQFATGTSGFEGQIGTKTKGIVSLIKAQTDDYATLIGFLLQTAAGETLTWSKGNKKHVPSFKDRLDATNSLLDRSIGKPTQQIYHTSDEETKELMANRVRLRVLEQEEKAAKRKDVSGKPVIEHEDVRVTAIGAMREKESG